jgi:voltage-gated potassium channel
MTFLEHAFKNPRRKSFWVINDVLAFVITVSSVAIFLETIPNIAQKYRDVLHIIDVVSAIIFTIEYVIYLKISKRTWKYVFSFYGIVDLLSFLPTYFGLFGLQFLKILRFSRLFRLLRMFRMLKLIEIMKKRLNDESRAMSVLKLNLSVYLFSFIILVLISSVILFEIENGIPGTQILTIQDSLWTTLSALSSVGFGNVFPVSFAGRMFMGLIMFLGVGFLSFAVVIFGKFIQKVLFGADLEEEMKKISDPYDEVKVNPKEKNHRLRY